ncbi:transposable element Tcb1 transposase [Trichonephila clavipes]|nr:transposable element Tcb1 transposase [Trichonephila clavipes]
MKEGCGRQNGMKLSLLTSRTSVCNTTMVGFESGNTVRMLNSCVMHHFTDPTPGIMIELLPWPDRSQNLSPIENMCSTVAQRLTQITPTAATPDQLWQRVEAAWSAVPQEHIQSLFESMPRRVAAVISNNGGYSGY